jgi:2,4-dienoyl-CoA reductase-like NADH-dependent reductase (Old Yellow Enzyme family)/thioredoxin reductase
MLEKLFSPGKIGTLELKNRIIMPPMLVGMGSTDGYVTDQMIAYYEERAKGHPGMIEVESTGFRPGGVGRCFVYYIDANEDKYIPKLTELAESIKKHGVRVAMQIGDGGRETRRSLTGQQPIAPSAIATRKRETPREMTKDDIKWVIEQIVKTARNIQKCGYEAIEIHGAHVYFFSQFLSAATNKRTDEYGGSVENRSRIVCEVIKAIKQTLGQNFPVWTRINATEYYNTEGIDINQAMEISTYLEKAGSDAIHISSGDAHYIRSMAGFYVPPGYLLPKAEKIKSVVKIPVIAVGRITPAMGEEALKAKQADFIGFGRGMIVDPMLPDKAKEGRLEDIAPCIACLQCSNRAIMRDAPTTCTVNAAVGLEREWAIKPTAKPKTVAIVGAGPAGLETARVAALIGHKVTVYEKEAKTGGSLILQAMPPCKDTINGLITYLNTQLAKSKVKVELGKEATTDILLKQKPDAVIIASGTSAACGPAVAGDGVTTAAALYLGKSKAGKNAIIVGDDRVALEAADFLSEKGVKTTVVSTTTFKGMAPIMLASLKILLRERLDEKKVTLINEVNYGAITAKGMKIKTADGAWQEIAADTIVFTDQASVDANMLSALRKSVPETYVIGDAMKKQEHQDAIFDGSRVARLV